MMLVAYIDRVVISVAGPSITKSLHLSKAEFGYVLSAFTLGYAVLQIPGGYLADRFGPRPMLIVALLVWSLFTGLTGIAASLAVLLAIRVLFGVGEGIENGAQFKLIGHHFSGQERSRAAAFFLTALALGPAIATPAASWILGKEGWQTLFFLCAIPGLIVAFLLYRYLPSDTASEPEPVPANWRGAFGARTWFALAGYSLFNMAFWGFLSWVPTYLQEQRHFSLKNFGIYGSTPYLCGFIGMVIAGHLGSHGLFRARGLIVAGCYASAAVCLYLALHASSSIGCIAGLSGAAFFLYGGFGPFWATAIGIARPETRGAFTGFINCGGQIGGFTAQIAIGYMVDRMKSFDDAIIFMMVALFVAAASMIGYHFADRNFADGNLESAAA